MDSDLPPLHARWMSNLLPAPIPRETKAACGDCVMCPGKGAEPEEAFAPETKCCTFVPSIPNFLAGRALADPELAEGRRSLEARIAAREWLSPLGLGITEDEQTRYRTLKAAGLFGKPGAELRCPHYVDRDGGLCGLWRHRPAVCATWFCKHERGQVGHDFWRSMRRLLAKVEDSLSVWCVLQAGFEPAALEALFPEEREPDLDRAWGPWRGREADFYKTCAARVEALAWDEIRRIGGASVEALCALAAEGFRKLLDVGLPATIAAGEYRMAAAPDRLRLRGYMASDWIDLPPGWLDFLMKLESEDTASAVDRLRQAGAPDVEAVLRRLLDLGILA
ncbi:MAG TPA: hypothetical protein VF950_14205 [Planctomycetota bacterium]